MSASDSARIAATKVERLGIRFADLHRTAMTDMDARIFPGYFTLVMVIADGRRVLRPMRYLCRLSGMPAYSDKIFPGTYSINSEAFWCGQFGHNLGLVVLSTFYEHFEGAGADGSEEVNLGIPPQPQRDLLVACLWSSWTGHGALDLDSFADVTDEPPIEVATAGHDR